MPDEATANNAAPSSRPGNEIDEEEQVRWGDLAVAQPLRLAVCCTGLAPSVALQDLLPPGSIDMVAAWDCTGHSTQKDKANG